MVLPVDTGICGTGPTTAEDANALASCFGAFVRDSSARELFEEAFNEARAAKFAKSGVVSCSLSSQTPPTRPRWHGTTFGGSDDAASRVLDHIVNTGKMPDDEDPDAEGAEPSPTDELEFEDSGADDTEEGGGSAADDSAQPPAASQGAPAPIPIDPKGDNFRLLQLHAIRHRLEGLADEAGVDLSKFDPTAGGRSCCVGCPVPTTRPWGL